MQDWSAWGVSWLGSWGNSWGPLHLVDENPWDTSQGVARNRNTLLKFRPIQDIAYTLVGHQIAVRTGRLVVSVSSSAHVELAGHQVYVTMGSLYSCRGDAEPRITKASAVLAQCGRVEVSAEAWTCFTPLPLLETRSGQCSVSAGAEVVLCTVGVVTHSGSMRVDTVRNPTDEELVLLTLLARKRLDSRRVYR